MTPIYPEWRKEYMWEHTGGAEEDIRREKWNSQVAAVSFDAFSGAEALAVVGVAHAGVAVTLAGWTKDTKSEKESEMKVPQ